MTKLEKFHLDLNKDYAVVLIDAVSPFDVAKKINTLKDSGRNSLVWSYIQTVMPVKSYNRLLIDSNFRDEAREALGHSNNNHLNAALKVLVSIDFLKPTENKNEFIVNPILIYKDRLSFRANDIIKYYRTYEPEDNFVYNKFVAKHGSMDKFADTLNGLVEEEMLKEGLGVKSTDPEDLKYL